MIANSKITIDLLVRKEKEDETRSIRKKTKFKEMALLLALLPSCVGGFDVGGVWPENTTMTTAAGGLWNPITVHTHTHLSFNFHILEYLFSIKFMFYIYKVLFLKLNTNLCVPPSRRVGEFGWTLLWYFEADCSLLRPL